VRVLEALVCFVFRVMPPPVDPVCVFVCVCVCVCAGAGVYVCLRVLEELVFFVFKHTSASSSRPSYVCVRVFVCVSF